MTRKTLSGPQGIRIELDSAEIFPDDPGQGTPAMVYVGEGDQHSGTYWAALNEGELICGRSGDYQLNASQHNWLAAQEETVGAFLDEHSPA
jgi:hypothetical protein